VAASALPGFHGMYGGFVGEVRGERFFELRVHGVGGDAPHRVLGLPYPTDVVAVPSLRGRRAVYAGRDFDGAYAYTWGELTSGSPLFALWTLLLPFTLANVAGWMHPPLDDDARTRRRVRIGAIRILVFLDGLLLTAAGVCWVATLMFGLFDHQIALVLTSALVAAALGGVLTGCKRFEGYRLGDGDPRYHSLHRPISLTDRSFFDGERTLVVHGVVHAVVAVVTTAVVLSVAAGDPSPAAAVGEWSVWLTTGGLTVALLTFLLGMTWRRGASEWRWGGSGTVSALSHLLLSGVVAAALSLLGESRRRDLGQALALVDVFGVAVAAGALVAIVTVIIVLLGGSPYEAMPLPPAERLLGDDAAARRTARIAQLPRHVDLPITALGLVGIVAAVWVVVFEGRGADSDWQMRSNVWTWLALLVLLPVLGILVRDVGRNALSVDRRRRVGQIWDVLAFWPRAFHPLAVRPYGERVVPEMVEILGNRTEVRTDRWIVTAHSQGAVIVMAAVLAGSRDARPTDAPEINVITFGTPLRQLYAKAFPHYVDDRVFAAFSDRLSPGGWLNIWRATDPVGREIYDDGLRPRAGQVDRVLPQPNNYVPRRDPSSTDLEQDTPLGAVDAHSGYRRSRALRAEVARLRGPSPTNESP